MTWAARSLFGAGYEMNQVRGKDTEDHLRRLKALDMSRYECFNNLRLPLRIISRLWRNLWRIVPIDSLSSEQPGTLK